MPIKWREQMSVGNHTIDMDHRLLICKINMIELALQAPGEEMINLTVALDELEDYTKVHFKREEKLQIAMSYPKYDEHKFQHQELVSRLMEIKKQILGISVPSQLAEQAPKLTKLLRDWLMDHVFTEDMKLKPYCAKYPTNYAP